jgi:transcriptional regulator with XRE-family HTH domain
MANSRLVDTRWFKDRLEERHLSQRKVAKHLQIDYAATSRLFRGLRDVKASEAQALATLLDLPVSEVMARFGLDVALPPGSRVPIVGWTDRDGQVHTLESAATEFVPAPPFRGAVALRDQSGTVQDGWLMYYKPLKSIGSKAIGRLSVVELQDTGEKLIRRLEVAPRGDAFFLVASDGDVVRDARIKSASCIQWVKP